MATNSNQGETTPPSTVQAAGAVTGSRTSSTTTATEPKRVVEHAQLLAERAVLVPVGASLMARDNLVSSVKGLASTYGTRASVERKLKRYELRGASARNRFERQVRQTRTKFERELRQRRTRVEETVQQNRRRVEQTVQQNRRRVEHEVRSVRNDLEKQSGGVVSRVEKIVSDAQDRLATIA